MFWDVLYYLVMLNGICVAASILFKHVFKKIIRSDCINYPYEVDGRKGVFTIRKPSSSIEWAFLASFVVATGAVLYKMNTTVGATYQPEAKRRICDKYKRFARMSMFATLFPLACYNSTDEILAFCKYVAEYYRTCMGLADFATDAISMFDDLTSLPEQHPQTATEKPAKPTNWNRGCRHLDITCGQSNSPFTPCNVDCGGHHCVHHPDCQPLYSPDTSQQVREDDDDVHDLVEEKHDNHMQSKDDDVSDPVWHCDSDDDSDGESVDLPEVSPRVSWLDRQIAAFRGTSSEARHEEIMLQRAEAEERLRKGETHFGLGYRHPRPDSVWKRLQVRFNTFTTRLTAFVHASALTLKYWYARYQWWFIGGAAVCGAAGLLYVVNRVFSSKAIPEGGKKKNRGGKKDRADRGAARAAVSGSSTNVRHNISSGQEQDLKRAQRDIEEEEERRQHDREMADEYERVWGTESASFSHDGVKYLDMDRKQLLKEFARIRNSWADKKDLKEKRERFSAIMRLLNAKYPKEVSKDEKPKTTNKVEHFQKDSLPFHTPKQFAVKSTRKGVASYTTCFPYANSVYIPRHGVCGAEEIVLLVGGKEVPIKSKGVIVKNHPDWVQFPAPAGLPQNKGLKFRAPEQGETVALFWVNSDDPLRSAQTVGVVGDTVYLGSDKKLKVVEYSGTSVNGSCGGIYIATKDGYVVGEHGIGSENVSVKPRFYPMSPTWYEDSKDAANHTKNYSPVEDTDYYNKMVSAINNKTPFESLNL